MLILAAKLALMLALVMTSAPAIALAVGLMSALTEEWVPSLVLAVIPILTLALLQTASIVDLVYCWPWWWTKQWSSLLQWTKHQASVADWALVLGLVVNWVPVLALAVEPPVLVLVASPMASEVSGSFSMFTDTTNRLDQSFPWSQVHSWNLCPHSSLSSYNRSAAGCHAMTPCFCSPCFAVSALLFAFCVLSYFGIRVTVNLQNRKKIQIWNIPIWV